MSMDMPGERWAVRGDRDFRQNMENGEISGLLFGSILYFDEVQEWQKRFFLASGDLGNGELWRNVEKGLWG